MKDVASKAIEAKLRKATDPAGGAPWLEEAKRQNDLGDHTGQRAAPSPIETTTLARRYRGGALGTVLGSTPDLAPLAAAAKAIAAELAIQNDHSPSVQDQKIRALQDRYAADPSTANAELLRHARTLNQEDHGRAVFASRQRVLAITAEVLPLQNRILRAAAALAEREAEALRAHDAALAEAFAVKYTDSGLTRGLFQAAQRLANEGKAERSGTDLAEFIKELVRLEISSDLPAPAGERAERAVA
jgi:hypothetical protein